MMTVTELNSVKEIYVRAFMQENDSKFITDIINYFLKKSKERDENVAFYNDTEALQSFKESVQQANDGLTREVSLNDVKQMLGL